MASASISDSLGSRRPFSSSDRAEGARPTRSPSSARVSPRERRRCRSRWPNVVRSRPLVVNDDDSFGSKSVTSSAYVKSVESSGPLALVFPGWLAQARSTTQGTAGRGRFLVSERRLEGTANGSTANGSNGHPAGPASRASQQAAALRQQWSTDPRWRGTERTYTRRGRDPAARLGARRAHPGLDGRAAAVAPAARGGLRRRAGRADRQPGGAAGAGRLAGHLPVRLAGGRGRQPGRRDVPGPEPVPGQLRPPGGAPDQQRAAPRGPDQLGGVRGR